MLDCFVAAGSELMRTQVAPEADAFTFAEIAGHEGVSTAEKDYADAEAPDVLRDLRAVTNEMDELEVAEGGRILFITPTLKGLLDDFSLVNPNMSKHVLARFSCIVEVPQRRIYSHIELLSGEQGRFSYEHAFGSYAKTADTEVASGKVYWERAGDMYDRVVSPTKSGLANYYETTGAGTPINWMVVEKSAVIIR